MTLKIGGIESQEQGEIKILRCSMLPGAKIPVQS